MVKLRLLKLKNNRKYVIIIHKDEEFYMKKKFNIFVLLLIIMMMVILPSCKKDEENELKDDKIVTIYSVNDFHGAIKDKAAKVANYINKNKNETSVIVSAGDMFQGSAISNYSKGRDMVNIMNMIGFDSMTVGNHEFDWELDTILAYFDGDAENGEANFPFLGCNVVDKRTNGLPKNMKEYQIVEKNDLKIGIIGYIGVGLEDSIATRMVENYEFTYPVDKIASISKKLRTEEGVNIVIAVGHDASSVVNKDLAELEGDERIDAVVNGHTHVRSTGFNKRISDNVNVPYVQAGSSGEYVGKIELTYSYKEKKVISGKSTTQTIMSTSKDDPEVLDYVNNLIEETAPVFERVIGTAGKNMSRSNGVEWSCNTLLEYCKNNYDKCDVAFINIGGIREAAFPINENEAITVNRIYQLMPFDNTVKMVTLSGKVLYNLFTNGGEVVYSTNSVKLINNTYYINGTILDENGSYRVAVIDYIFDKETYPFMKGTEINATGILFRDILIEKVENDTSLGNKSFLEEGN